MAAVTLIPPICLGPSQIWDSVPFKFGPANANDVVKCSGQTVALPANRYTTLLLLAAAVDGSQASQTFTLTYTDGTTTPIVQSLSDWVVTTAYSNQFTAVTMPYRATSSGGSDASASHVFGCLFALDNTKTVRSLRMPNNANVEVLGLTLANTPLPVSLESHYNRGGMSSDGTHFTSGTGLDNDGNAYSATLLGPARTWHNSLFEFGPANATNVVSAAAQSLALPQGQYSALLMLAASVNGSQSGQSFTVHYTNGATTTFTASISDWASPQGYSGESTVVAMGYRDSSGGGQVGPPVNLYGYSFALNANNVVQSLTLPNNNNVEILALTLSNFTAALPEAPAIVTQPASLTVTNGNPAAFTVQATGSPALHYQWQLNATNLSDGGNISGSSSAALTVTAAGANDAGSYDVIVNNSYGSVTSSVVTLNVVFFFASAAQSGSAVTFTWQSTTGVSYQVQYTTDLSSSNWLNLGAPIIATNSVTTASDNLGPDPQRFYRIIQQ